MTLTPFAISSPKALTDGNASAADFKDNKYATGGTAGDGRHRSVHVQGVGPGRPRHARQEPRLLERRRRRPVPRPGHVQADHRHHGDAERAPVRGRRPRAGDLAGRRRDRQDGPEAPGHRPRQRLQRGPARHEPDPQAVRQREDPPGRRRTRSTARRSSTRSSAARASSRATGRRPAPCSPRSWRCPTYDRRQGQGADRRVRRHRPVASTSGTRPTSPGPTCPTRRASSRRSCATSRRSASSPTPRPPRGGRTTSPPSPPGKYPAWLIGWNCDWLGIDNFLYTADFGYRGEPVGPNPEFAYKNDAMNQAMTRRSQGDRPGRPAGQPGRRRRT